MTTTATPPVTTASLLSATGLRRAFRMGDADVAVLKHVDLDIAPGEFVAIEGRSGSGKSTLLHILGLLDTPTAGQIDFDGNNVARLSGSARSKIRNAQFGFVFQFYYLLPELNVIENTMLASMIEYSWLNFRSHKRALSQRATKLLTQFGLEHRLKHKVTHLSGGERQRVAIARALMNQPRVLFADEPTGNLDDETGRQIMGVLETLHREHGQTIVMVTHDRALASQADRVLVLKDGVLEPA